MLIPSDQHPVCVQFYVSRAEKRAFQQACRLSDTTMSREFRRFMRWFVQNPPGDDRSYYQPVTRMDGRSGQSHAG